MSKWIAIGFVIGILSACAEYSQPQTRNPQWAYCHAIGDQLNAVYPSTLRGQQLPIEKAKLLRAYHSYDCENK